MTDIRAQVISQRLAEANLKKVGAAGRHCKTAFDIVEAQSGSSTAEQKVLHRRRLEHPVIARCQEKVSARNVVAQANARTQCRVLNQQAIVIHPDPNGGREVSEPDVILDESGCFGASPPVVEVEVKLREFI